VSSLLATAAAPPRFFYGWWIVFASAAIVFMSAGTFFYGFGLLVGPLTQEFGWSRAAVSAAFSLRTEVGGVAAPFVGFIVDRVGPRVLVLLGVWVVGAGFVLLSLTQSLWAFYGAVIVIAIGGSATGGPVSTVTIAHWFERRRSRAFGLLTFGGGLSGVTAIVLAWLIAEFGWREALVIIGVTQLAVCTPLALSIRNRPADMGLSVDGAPPTPSGAGDERLQPAPSSLGLTSREAIKSTVFWRVALVFALSNFATTAIIVHQVPFLTESVGASEAFAAATVTAMTFMSLVGRLAFGSVADFLPKRFVVAAALLAISASLALFATVHETWQLVYVLPLFALGFGGIIPVRSSLQAEYFGLRAFGAIQGMSLTVATIGAFAGPVLAGWLYDVTDSYRLAFVLLAIGPLLAVPLILSAQPETRAHTQLVDAASH
jgi:sugar phosphate permease